MSQFTQWDNAKLVAETHQRDLYQLSNPLVPAEKPVQREPAPQQPLRTRLSAVLAVIVALSNR
jgi:hypothetical protein